MIGYAHADYARSLVEFGAPRHLPACGGWILERETPGGGHRDGMGCYPLFFCRDWLGLPQDIEALRADLVAISLVKGPFDDCDANLLERCFDRVVHFKDHYVADLAQPIEQIVKPSHRATVRRAMKRVDIRQCERPADRLDDWVRLFHNLAERHGISGIKAFSREAFAAQLAVPGLVMFEAVAGSETVGLDLWYQQTDVAYGHLAAYSELGYELRAAYATKWHVLRHFADKVRWIDFGGGAGVKDGSSGLTAFKAGWSTGTKPVYFCGRVLQPELYRRLVESAGVDDDSYFPAYRQGEFR